MDGHDVGCERCGQRLDAAAVYCGSCGASLLLEVVLVGEAPAERERFLGARAVAALGPPAPAFAELRRALERPGAVVVRDVSRAFASRVVSALESQGLPAQARQVRPTPAAPAPARTARPGWRSAAWAGLGLLLVVGAGALVAWRVGVRRERDRPRADPAQAAAAQARPDEALSTRDIARKALPATVSLRCDDSVGSGFFVEPEVLLTNAHVACPKGRTQKVTLHDGRELTGETLEKDEDLDLASVRVAGANATPLPLGDATTLEAGDRVVFIGSPRGLAFTLHEGRVSFVGREHLGVGYVQFDASVNPGNSGGPLLDASGRVVGVVSMKVMNAEGLGLALPVQYADAFVTRTPASGEVERWQALRASVRRAEQRTLASYDVPPGRPMLLTFANAQGRVAVLVLARASAQPARQTHGLTVSGPAGRWCDVPVEFVAWQPLLREGGDGDDDDVSPALRRYLARQPFGRELYVGAGRVPLENCPPPPSEGPLSLRMSHTPDGRELRLTMDAVEAARRFRAPPTPEGVPVWRDERQGAADSRERSEQQWRDAFRQRREEVARAQRTLEDFERSWLGDNTTPEARRYRETFERRLAEARAYLEVLQGQALQAGIPPEWWR